MWRVRGGFGCGDVGGKAEVQLNYLLFAMTNLVDVNPRDLIRSLDTTSLAKTYYQFAGLSSVLQLPLNANTDALQLRPRLESNQAILDRSRDMRATSIIPHTTHM